MISTARPKSTRVTRIHNSATVTTSRTLAAIILVMALIRLRCKSAINSGSLRVVKCLHSSDTSVLSAGRFDPSFERRLGDEPVAMNSDLPIEARSALSLAMSGVWSRVVRQASLALQSCGYRCLSAQDRDETRRAKQR
jgi:hypothetical protein